MTGTPTVLFCVGATKAGTSWLYRHLHRHPDCHLRSIKELHYFDMLESGTQRRFRKLLRERIARLRAAIADGNPRPSLERQLRDALDWKAVIGAEGENLDAYLGYLSEGRGARPLVADITPAYALLPETRLHRMAEVAPRTRFLYLLRDPVARLWSQARMLAARRMGDIAEFPALAARMMDSMLEAIRSGLRDREDYIGAISRLRAAVAPDRLLIQFQDDMMTVPGLSRLQAFLGISDIAGDFENRVHEGTPLALPDDLRARARAVLAPQYQFVARHFPDLPGSWRQNMTEVHG
ncbi:MAG: sulfotransferase [Paracoccaceae bacterium]